MAASPPDLNEVLHQLAENPRELLRRLKAAQAGVDPKVRERWARMAAAGNRQMQERIEQLDALDTLVSTIEHEVDELLDEERSCA